MSMQAQSSNTSPSILMRIGESLSSASSMLYWGLAAASMIGAYQLASSLGYDGSMRVSMTAVTGSLFYAGDQMRQIYHEANDFRHEMLGR